MHIHTVKPGDTVFKIAREYATSPMKIIENNELSNPDRLTPGEKLLILTPTRTYTVRGSDTLKRIADRFGVKYNSLLAKNPALRGSDKIYPGQLLTVKEDTPRYGVAAANGYYYKGTPRDRLSLCIPYLSYITVAAGRREGDEVALLFDDTEVLDIARERGVIALLRVYDGQTDFTDSYIDNLILLAKTHGYGGITLAAYTAARSAPEKFGEFIIRLKEALSENDLLLFLEIDANSDCATPDGCDGYVLMYEKCCLDKIPSFKDGEMRVVEDFISKKEPSRAYIDIPSFGYTDGEEIMPEDAVRLAHTSGQEITYDGEKMVCHFSYNRYRGGKKESVSVFYDSLENIKAKLSLVGELGLMGISFDIAHIPTSTLMMFEATFNRPFI